MTITIDTKSAKIIRTQPVHQWDSVSLQFPDSAGSEEIHFETPGGTATVVEAVLQTVEVPSALLGESFDGDIRAHLVSNGDTLNDIIIPVIPRQKGANNE